jgi:hypothetical protein
MDVCGPLQMSTYDGCKYFTVFVDEYTKYKWVYIHQDKTTSIKILKQWMLDATKGTDLKIGCLRTDGAGEHMSKAYQDVLRSQNIRIECLAAMIIGRMVALRKRFMIYVIWLDVC